jgi:hypothetical protein
MQYLDAFKKLYEGDFALSCGKDSTIIVWDVKKAIQQFPGQRTGRCEFYRINGFPLNPDGNKWIYF